MSGSGDLRRTAALFRRYSAGQGGRFTLAGFLLAAETAAAIGVPNVLGWLLDFIQDPSHPLSFAPSRTQTIAFAAALIVVLEAAKSLGDSMAEISLAKAGRTLGYNLRVSLFGHLQKLSLAFHLRRKTGDVLTRITSDVAALEEFVVASMSDLVGSVLLIVGTLAVLLVRSVQVTLLALIIVPLLAVVSNVFASRIKVASKVLRAREGDLASSAHEMLTSIGVVQIYGRGGYEEDRFAERSHSTMEAVLRTARLEAAFSFVVSLLEAFVVAAVIWIGAVVIGEPGISTGTLVAFVLMMDQMFKPTRRIIKEWNTISKIYASVERINDLLDREPAVQDGPDAVEAPPLQGHLEFRDVSFAYQPGTDDDSDDSEVRLALDNLSFTAEPGEVIALVGHSGAGKSTIAQLLPRLYDPQNGAVLVDGYDVRNLTIASLRGQISMVLQETVLFSGTVAENIAYGREGATWDEVVTAAKRANAHDFITAMPEGYDTVLGERAATLSGGQRQRLAIARAFIRQTPILILDEPTTGLDAESADLVLRALEGLVRGRTALIISHDLNLMRIADRLLVISGGRILEEGTSDDLLARGGLYADLYARQFGALPEPVPEPTVPAQRDDGPARARREFETVLMQAMPLPASPEEFQVLTGHRAPDQRGAHSANGQESDLDGLRAPALVHDMPSLAEALDSGAMAPHLQSMLTDGWLLEGCTPGKVLVEPGEGATLRYRVVVRDPDSGRTHEHLVGGRLLPLAEPASEWVGREMADFKEQAGGRKDLAAFASTILVVPPLNLVLHCFPLDPDLPGLLRATDPSTLRETLADTLVTPVDGLVPVDARANVVQYARRGRCVLRYEVLWRFGEGGRVLKQVVYGKVYADDQGSTVGPAVGAVQARLDSLSTSQSRFLVPRFQGYLGELRLSLLDALPGSPRLPGDLREWVSIRTTHPTLSAELDAAAAIAAVLHTVQDAPHPLRTLAGELSAASAEVRLLARYAPALGDRLSGRLSSLATALTDASPPAVVAHGDLTPAQILFDGPLRALVDFDTMCRAEPAMDLGQFTAYLRLIQRKAETAAGHPAPEGAEPARRFLDSYADRASVADPEALRDRAAVFRSITLTRVAARSWLQLKPARVRLALGLLDDEPSTSPRVPAAGTGV